METKKGFTLIELLVVVLIVGILAAVALPQYQLAVVKSRVATIRPVLASIRQAQENYYMANGKYADDISMLAVDLPLCTSATDCSTCLVCGNYFMIDSLSGDTIASGNQNLRAAYCPKEIQGDKNWAQCAYENGDFIYRVFLAHSRFPNQIDCERAYSALGEKICKHINNGN